MATRLFVDLEDFKVIGKSNDQLRFDVKLYLDNDKDHFMLLKGYRLIGGKVTAPMSKTAGGGFYTIAISFHVESMIRTWFILDVHKLKEKFPSVQFPVDGRVSVER
jgi:hypothetical protein